VTPIESEQTERIATPERLLRPLSTPADMNDRVISAETDVGAGRATQAAGTEKSRISSRPELVFAAPQTAPAVIQARVRQDESQAPTSELSTPPETRSAAQAPTRTETAAAGGGEEADIETEATDVDAIARDVYRILKRRLARERERALGLS
jgi:hypothetical protein